MDEIVILSTGPWKKRPMKKNIPTVLFVDDHEVLSRISCEILQVQGYRAFPAYDGFGALEIFAKEQVDAVVTDYRMAGMNGVELANQIWEKNPKMPIVVVYGYGLPEIPRNRPITALHKEDLFPELLEVLKAIIPDNVLISGQSILQPLGLVASGQLHVSPEIVTAGGNFVALLGSIVRNPADLLCMSPRKFEEFVAGVWEELGYEVELTVRTRDGGRDVIAVRRAEAHLRFLIECKRYSPENKVDVSLVRSLYGIVRDENATKGILATTSSFTRGAKTFLDRHKWELDGTDFEGIVKWVRRAQAKAKSTDSE